MKRVLLSADNEISVYSVPDVVADHLDKYCTEFHSKWLWESPDAAKYHVTIRGSSGVCFDERDFIDYLNKYICKEPSTLIEKLPGVLVKMSFLKNMPVCHTIISDLLFIGGR